jgi:hypothetical protein
MADNPYAKYVSAPAAGVFTLPPSPQQQRNNDRQDRTEGRQAGKDALDAANDAERLRLDRERLIASLYEKGLRPGPNGPEPIPGWQPPIDPTKPTEYQAKSGGFLGRMLQSNADFQAVPPEARDPRSWLGQKLHDNLPGIEGSLATWLGGNSPERQLADQASRNFISSSLRQESGAAINSDEFDRQYQIFYPQPGDDNVVIEQKRRAREQAIDGFRTAAGPVAPRIESAQRNRTAPRNFTPEVRASANQELAGGFRDLTGLMQNMTPQQRQTALRNFNNDPRVQALKSRAGFRDPGGTRNAPRLPRADDIPDDIKAIAARLGGR